MQPPPRAGPPGASGPPPSGPNMFRRTRPPKHATAATATMPPPTQPMTDPFAFGRAQPPMAAGGLPTIPNSNPPQMQTPPGTIYSQLGPGQPAQLPTLDDVPAAPTGPPLPSMPGVALFNPHSSASSGIFPAPSSTGYASSNSEQDYFNSRHQTPTTSTESPHMAPHIAPTPSEAHFNQEFQGQPAFHPAPFQPLAPTSSSAQWVPDHGSRPPSVQNYFQPTSDPPVQPLNMTPQTQKYPSHSQSPHLNAPTPPIQPGHPHNQACLPPQNPVTPNNSAWPDPNGPHQQNSHFQSYFNQSSEPQDLWFNQPPQDSGYHQMGIGPSHPQPIADSAGYQHVSNTGHGPTTRPGPTSDSASDPYSQESGSLSMFFKDSDVENEETLSSERNKALNGGAGFFQPHSNPQAHSGHADTSLNYQGVSVQDNSHLPYMNESSPLSQGNTQKPPDTQFDHVENLECVPNQEVLPSEIHSSTAVTAPHGVDQFETGPNLETPDSVPRPMRSASVSSNYSNLSHGSGTGPRRHKGVEGTFIQQESPRLADNANPSAATGGYFEQIDSSPAGDAGMQQSSLEQMWPPTPSPPKPTGIFQASANSSFEPVRSHGVGVRPPEVDRAKMVAEGGTDTSGNLEQPPDNMENIYSPGQPQPAAAAAAAGSGMPHVTHPVVHSRPSSRAFGANRPCESPATTLWAQNDPSSLSANILLAPAALTVLAPLREPSADVIQPPEDGPLDLQLSQKIQPTSQQHSENLENPPKVSDSEPNDSQGNLGYASLLVSGSLHQPVLIAPPVSNYNVIPPSAPAQSSTQSSHGETTPPERSLAQGQGASSSQPPALPSKQNPLFSSGPTPQPVHPPLSRGQSLSGDNHSAVHVNSQSSSLVTASVSNHNRASNYELLDFSMHQSHARTQQPDQPSSLHEMPQSSNGFYLQVTKDAQQGAREGGNASVQTSASLPTPQVPLVLSQAGAVMQQTQNESSQTSDSQAAQQGRKDVPSAPVSGAQPPPGQSSMSAQGPTAGSAPTTAYPPGPQGPVPPGSSHPASAEPPRPPSSAGSHQGGYGPPPPPPPPPGPGQTYSGYYGNYGEYPDSRGPYPQGQYPPPHGDPRAQQYYQVGAKLCTRRKEGYDDQWRYYPGYDASFDDDNQRGRDPYGDDFDRRSVHSERSAHSVHSSHSHHSRRSSFSSRSQQSQVYRSQPDLVSAGYDTTSSTLAVDYSYGQYPNQADASQNYSQYPYASEYTSDSTWVAPEQPPPRPATPEKFTIPHRCARFGPGGHLIQVLPNLPSAGQPALVDIHNMETMLQDTSDQAELRVFPGPLLKEETHKVDVIKFSQNKALECARDNNLLDRESARLLWDFIMLLCRQNGTVVGTDIADLLLKEHRSVWLPGKSPNEANLIDFNNEPLARAEEEPGAGPLSLLSDTFMTVPENVGKETERFRELLLFGRKKDALEAAMKGGLWGHALLLASKMDNRTHARVMTRFANSLPMNDPLQTMYQLMSGRMPASATCCGEEKWGDWRPHLAMVLSNLTHNLDLDTRTITTMGDTLASKGLTDAAHFCYLMAQIGLGVFTKKSTKMVLIGSNHSLPFNQFATNEAIQRTEAYEYAQSLGSQPCSLPNFQVFKLIYACRLAEAGLCAQAFHYCEVISKSALMHPSYYSPVFISQIIQMSERLRFFDPQLKEKPEQELFVEPEWLIRLRQLDGQIRVRKKNRFCHVPMPGYHPQEPGMAPPPFLPQTEQFDMYPGAHQQQHFPSPQEGQMSPRTLPSQVPHSPIQMIPPPLQIQQHMPPSPGHLSPMEQPSLVPPEMHGVQQISSSPPRSSYTPQMDLYDHMAKMSKSWLFWPFGKRKNEAHLPDDKNPSIVWDEQKNRWVDLNEPEEESKPPPPPPTGFPKMPQMPGPGGPAAPPSSGVPVNIFSRKAGTKSRYVDVLNPSRTVKPSGGAPAPVDIFAPLAPMPMPANLFVPSSGLSRSSSMSSLSREVSQHLNQVFLVGR
uniref:Protein transport protein sec16 n=1 Tax=Kryptolebias marmoratus TaxID=37003 RepID=A0A3Q3AUN4_KRYMA